jgi:hypothetical protein
LQTLSKRNQANRLKQRLPSRTGSRHLVGHLWQKVMPRWSVLLHMLLVNCVELHVHVIFASSILTTLFDFYMIVQKCRK